MLLLELMFVSNASTVTSLSQHHHMYTTYENDAFPTQIFRSMMNRRQTVPVLIEDIGAPF